MAMLHLKAGFFFCLILWLLWLGWLWLESRRHRKNLERITLRIHVNGTRGKSGVTRLVAAGLRAGGKRVCAKVTGTDAKFIAPDGGERSLLRRGPANIREYLALAREAVDCGADTLVAECMALRPELQNFCEHKLMRSHIGVITNVRHDHEEIMGPTLLDIAVSLGQTIPSSGGLVTTPAAFELLRAGCGLGADTVKIVQPETVTQQEVAELPFEVERENLALALAVCELAGVDRVTALAGMRESRPDRGNLTVQDYRIEGHRIRVVNAMAANDPDSTQILWNRYAAEQGKVVGVVLHARPDRRLRTRQLGRFFAVFWPGPYYLTGDAAFAAKCLRQAGVADRQIVVLPEPEQERVLWAVAATMQEPDGILFEAGNMKGFVA